MTKEPSILGLLDDVPDVDVPPTPAVDYWTRPARCDTNKCAEVARADGGGVLIRNSTSPMQVVWLSADEWDALRADIAAGGLGNMARI